MRPMLICLAALGTACSDDGPAAPAPVASVTIEPPSFSMGLGTTVRLTVILRDAAGNRLDDRWTTFISSNGTVASVDDFGEVRAQTLGAATITALSEGKRGQTVISVEPNDSCAGCWDARAARRERGSSR